MNRLTTMGPDGRPMMTAGTSIIELTERLYHFEEALGNILALDEDKEDYTDGIN